MLTPVTTTVSLSASDVRVSPVSNTFTVSLLLGTSIATIFALPEKAPLDTTVSPISKYSTTLSSVNVKT